jgi:hypothetical protein
MAYYDALIAQWASLPAGDSTAQKLAAVNAMTVAGPNIDVAVSSVVGYLALNGKLSVLQKYAANPPATEAGIAGAELVALLMCPNAPAFRMSDGTTYAAVSAFLNALAGDGNSGIAANDVTALLALATGPMVTWCHANGYPDAALGGGGLTMIDVAAAGLN